MRFPPKGKTLIGNLLPFLQCGSLPLEGGGASGKLPSSLGVSPGVPGGGWRGATWGLRSPQAQPRDSVGIPGLLTQAVHIPSRSSRTEKRENQLQ